MKIDWLTQKSWPLQASGGFMISCPRHWNRYQSVDRLTPFPHFNTENIPISRCGKDTDFEYREFISAAPMKWTWLSFPFPVRPGGKPLFQESVHQHGLQGVSDVFGIEVDDLFGCGHTLWFKCFVTPPPVPCAGPFRLCQLPKQPSIPGLPDIYLTVKEE